VAHHPDLGRRDGACSRLRRLAECLCNLRLGSRRAPREDAAGKAFDHRSRAPAAPSAALAAEFEKQRRAAETHLGRVADVRRDYRLHLVDALRDHLIRGFAPQVGGRVISLPLAKIFLPLQAVEGRPALAEYAEQDLHRGSGETPDELSWRHQQAEIERRRSRPQAREGGERSLGLAELLKQRRAVLLGDPGTGKTTITRYVAYALAADDRTHIGDRMRGLLPVLVRLASYGKALNEDRDLDLVAYVESQLTPRKEFGRCLRKGIEAGECLIILDGLDEVTDPELRVQVTAQIRALVEEEREPHSALRWLAALSAQPPSIEIITKLTAADTPPFIRLLAAEHMLNEGHRRHAIAVLQDLCANEPSVAAAAAMALLEVDEKSKLDWVLLREISLLANNPDAPEAIRVLLRGDRSDTAVPATLHFLATWRGDDFDLLSVVRDLMEAGQTALGLAAARWLAMRPGFEYRFEACEILSTWPGERWRSGSSTKTRR